MRILVTGASGLLGSALRPVLGDHEFVPLARRPSGDDSWEPHAGRLPAAVFETIDAVVHLSGETIAGLWTPAKKTRIRESRVGSTRLLSTTMAALPSPPPVLVCASAMGFYGDRGDELLTEDAAPGTGFLAELGRAWEGAADAARERGIRVVHLRFGLILSAAGGVLAALASATRWGLAARLGSGRQWTSWISIEDAARAILHSIETASLSGPVNAASPHPVTQATFTRLLARALRRPAFLSAPAVLLRLAPGGMAQEMLLASQRLVPERLQATDFGFRHPELEAALPQLLL